MRDKAAKWIQYNMPILLTENGESKQITPEEAKVLRSQGYALENPKRRMRFIRFTEREYLEFIKEE